MLPGNWRPTFKFYERVAEAARRPIIYQVIPALVDQPEQHREIIRWLEDCTRRGLRLYGQGEDPQRWL